MFPHDTIIWQSICKSYTAKLKTSYILDNSKLLTTRTKVKVLVFVCRMLGVWNMDALIELCVLLITSATLRSGSWAPETRAKGSQVKIRSQVQVRVYFPRLSWHWVKWFPLSITFKILMNNESFYLWTLLIEQIKASIYTHLHFDWL